MGKMISLTEYAAKHGVNADNVRQRVLRGTLLAQKDGRNWKIDEDTPYSGARPRLSPEQIGRLGRAYASLAWVMGKAAPNNRALVSPTALGNASMRPVIGLTQANQLLHLLGAASDPRFREYVDKLMMDVLEDVDPEDVQERCTMQDSGAWWIGYYKGPYKASEIGEDDAKE